MYICLAVVSGGEGLDHICFNILKQQKYYILSCSRNRMTESEALFPHSVSASTVISISLYRTDVGTYMTTFSCCSTRPSSLVKGYNRI